MISFRESKDLKGTEYSNKKLIATNLTAIASNRLGVICYSTLRHLSEFAKNIFFNICYAQYLEEGSDWMEKYLKKT